MGFDTLLCCGTRVSLLLRPLYDSTALLPGLNYRLYSQ